MSLCKKKDSNLSNYQGLDHSIYQPLVLYQVQSGLQAIAYLNFQISTSTSALIPTAYWLCHVHHPNAFISSSICLMIPDVHQQRSLHLIKSCPDLHTCQAWGPLVYYQEAFVNLVILTFLKTKLTSAQRKSLSCVQQGFHPHYHQGVLKGDMLHASTSG